jgi:hypothetical protein
MLDDEIGRTPLPMTISMITMPDPLPVVFTRNSTKISKTSSVAIKKAIDTANQFFKIVSIQFDS